ncbi:MAG TPA: hypothetical protein VJ385_17640 [Fibrobacteria bacterium]|nr:hypothetical protein [Fibrobacteria bacterium]
MWKPLLITSFFAAFSTVIGIILYSRGESYVKYRWARFSGATAIAIAAYFGMTRFYLELRQQDRDNHGRALMRFQKADDDFELCLGQEKEFPCRVPAYHLKNLCAEILEPGAFPP